LRAKLQNEREAGVGQHLPLLQNENYCRIRGADSDKQPLVHVSTTSLSWARHNYDGRLVLLAFNSWYYMSVLVFRWCTRTVSIYSSYFHVRYRAPVE